MLLLIMCERVGETERGTKQAPKGFPLQEEKEEEMRTKKIAMMVAMASVVLVALVGSGLGPKDPLGSDPVR
jgi:hypothetical protein